MKRKMDNRTVRRSKDTTYRLDGNLYQKYRYRVKSIETMSKELIKNGIKPIEKSDVHKTYEAVRIQWQNLRKELQEEKYEERLKKQNASNKERYHSDKKYRALKIKRSRKQYVKDNHYVQNLEKENAKLKRELNVR